jgi:hypothetical protein
MEFLNNLIRKIGLSKKSKKEENEEEEKEIDQLDLKDLNINLFFSYFTDVGMEVQAIGKNCRKTFDPMQLSFLSNYCAVFYQQAKGEDLFGPVPVPIAASKRRTDMDEDEIAEAGQGISDWFLLVYPFSTQSKTIKDERIARDGFRTAGIFIMLYPKKFDYFIMQAKPEIRTMFWKRSGILQEAKEFTNRDITNVEEQIEQMVKESYSKFKEDMFFPKFESVRKTIDYQRVAINERLSSLYSICNYHYFESEPEKNLVLLNCQNIQDIYETLKLHTPPTKQLDGKLKWAITNQEEDIVRIKMDKIEIVLFTPSQFEKIMKQQLKNEDQEVISLFLQDTIDNPEQIDVLKKFLEAKGKKKEKKDEHILENQLLLLGISNNNKHKELLEVFKKGKDKKLLETNTFTGFEDTTDVVSLFSQNSWLYDKLIERLMEIHQKTTSADSGFTKKERKGLEKVFKSSLHE